MFTPLEFKRCPLCGSEETAAKLACEGEPGIDKDQFVCLKPEVTFIRHPSQTLGLAPAIISYFDVCVKCGHYYCTKIEKKSLPVQIQVPGMPQMPQTPRFNPK